MESKPTLKFRGPLDKTVLLSIEDGFETCVASAILSHKLAPNMEQALKISNRYTLKADFHGAKVDLRQSQDLCRQYLPEFSAKHEIELVQLEGVLEN